MINFNSKTERKSQIYILVEINFSKKIFKILIKDK